MKVLTQLTLISALCFVAEIFSALLPFNLPKGVSAMIFLLIALLSGILKDIHIEELSSFLMKNMGIFFIPSTIAVIDDSQVLLDNVVVIVFICFATFIMTFLVACYTVKAVILLQNKVKGAKK